MNKRSVPIIVAGCILALAGLAGYFMPEPVEAPSPRILMENQGGRVVFTHKAHSTSGSAYGDNSCERCHHELKVAAAEIRAAEPPKVMACTACHGSVDALDFKESHQALYRAEGGDASCLSCHHLKISGYSEKWSHEDHWNYASDDCASCHHAEGKTPGGRMMTAIKPQRCANCHTAKPNPMTARTGKDASHETCRSCHEDLFEAKAKGCATCHTQSDLAAEVAKGAPDKELFACSSCHAPIPGGMDAFHAGCIGCHVEVKKGPGKAPEDCAKCHTP